MGSFVEDEISNAKSLHESEKKEQTPTNINVEGDEKLNDNPIEEVRLTVQVTDDPLLPDLTFRTWFLGMISCSLLALVNQFFQYRQNMLYVGSVSAQILVLPAGKLMAATLPSKPIRVPFTPWSFSLNRGPFNMKEHVLITIFAGCGSSGVYALYIITMVKAFYERPMNAVAAMLLVLTTQLLGYGWAGLFRKYLVDSPYMWWPSNLVQVSLFRALHEVEKRTKGGLSRLQFFLLVFVSSFVYYTVLGYLFPTLSALSFLCLIWKNLVTAQKIGSGLQGLGIGSFGLDWSTVAYMGSPLASPFFAIANILVGFVLFLYVLIPIAYWNNLYEAQRFPIVSPYAYDSAGQIYNVTRVLNEKEFDLDHASYENYSKVYLSIVFAFLYGLSFATLMTSISHVALFEGKKIWEMWKQTTSAVKDQFGDVHTRLMKENYKAVPQWWFHIVLVVTFALSIYACEGFDRQLQLPWWGIVLACGMAFFFTLPVGVIQATTNMQPGLNVITELIIGYMYLGKPLANVAFKTYGYVSMIQALGFLSDFKLGHYMKIPPRSMFIVQLVGTIVASTVCYDIAWWLLSSIDHICNKSLLPKGSPWTCPNGVVFYNASIIWGVVGPLKMFTSHGIYPQMNWFFLIGVLAPVPTWLLSRKFLENKWIKYIHMPLILAGPGSMPSAKAVHYWSWAAVGIFFNYYIFKRYNPQMNWFFLIGVLAPVPTWLLSRKFPEKKWIKYIHMPLILAGPGSMPSAKAVHYWSWAAVGIFFNYYIFKRYKGWWARHNYILSAALEAGLAFMGVLLYFALQSHDVAGPEWWGLDNGDHCQLASCPTAPGIAVNGCPVF